MPGEILGIAGLVGSGRSETARAIFGIDRLDSGEILIHGQPVTVHSPIDAMSAGLALVPEDRRLQGLVLKHTVEQNMVLPMLPSYRDAGIVSWRGLPPRHDRHDRQPADQAARSVQDRSLSQRRQPAESRPRQVAGRAARRC